MIVPVDSSCFDFKVDFVLIRIGYAPNTSFCHGLAMDDQGYLRITHKCETNQSGVFAVGDVANYISPTVTSAVGMAATAVKACLDFKVLKDNNGSTSKKQN